MILEFTNEEVNGLVELLDGAVRGGGLAVADNVMYFVAKLRAATQAEAANNKVIDIVDEDVEEDVEEDVVAPAPKKRGA